MLPLYIVLGVIAAFVVLAATRPTEFRIERSLRMNAPRTEVFALVNDFHNWSRWSPWAKIDPNMKVTFSGEREGVGARYAWAGNTKAGEGRMEIVESRPGEKVKILLDFLKPIRATNVAVFDFAAEGRETSTTWCMCGKRNFGMKAFSLFVNMDRMIGGDFERGLAALKELAESKTTDTPTTGTSTLPIATGQTV